MNSPFMVTHAQTIAQRVRSETAGTTQAAIERLYELLFSRHPTDDDLRLGATFLEEPSGEGWAQYTQVLLASNELLYLD